MQAGLLLPVALLQSTRHKLVVRTIYAHWPATIDHGNPLLLGVDHQALGDTIAGKGHDVAGIKREHLLVAFEPGTGPQSAIE